MGKINCKYCGEEGNFEEEGSSCKDFAEWSVKNRLWVSAVHGYICPECCISRNINGRGVKCPVCAEHVQKIRALQDVIRLLYANNTAYCDNTCGRKKLAARMSVGRRVADPCYKCTLNLPPERITEMVKENSNPPESTQDEIKGVLGV